MKLVARFWVTQPGNQERKKKEYRATCLDVQPHLEMIILCVVVELWGSWAGGQGVGIKADQIADRKTGTRLAS